MFGKSMAHVEKVVNVYPIEGADNLEMAQVLDYHVAVKKGEFKVGDLAVYIEIDSIVPDGLPEQYQPEMKELTKQFFMASKDEKPAIKEKMQKLSELNSIPEFEFLRSRGFKIRQVFFAKLKIYSQGILFTMDKFPQITNPKIGLDATDLLGIKQVIDDEEEAGVTEPTKVGQFLETNIVGKFINKKLMRFSWFRSFKKSIRQPKGIWHDYFPPKSDEENIQKIFTVFQEKDAISLVSRMNRIHYKHMLVVANKLYLRDGGILSEWTSEPLTEPCGSGNVLKVDARS